MKLEIKSRWSSKVLFTAELDVKFETEPLDIQIGAAVKQAILRDAVLSGAVLRGAVLRDAILRDADLSDAVLSGVDLRGADLRGVDLRGAVLRDAVLRDADLRGAILSGADLRGAILSGVDLSDVVLSGVDLSDVVLSGVDLSEFKQDLIAEILKLPNELEGIRQAIIDGKIDGTTYSTGDCSCLAGTIAKQRGIPRIASGDEISDNGCKFQVDSHSPRENWFMMITPGKTPENNFAAKMALRWVEEAIAIRNHIRTTK